jgi:hypothetical protein
MWRYIEEQDGEMVKKKLSGRAHYCSILSICATFSYTSYLWTRLAFFPLMFPRHVDEISGGGKSGRVSIGVSTWSQRLFSPITFRGIVILLVESLVLMFAVCSEPLRSTKKLDVCACNASSGLHRTNLEKCCADSRQIRVGKLIRSGSWNLHTKLYRHSSYPCAARSRPGGDYGTLVVFLQEVETHPDS